MDEINDFFDFTKDLKNLEAPVGCVTGSVHTFAGNYKPDYQDIYKRQQSGVDYAKRIVQEEYRQLAKFKPSNLRGGTKKDNQVKSSNTSNNNVTYDTNLPIYDKKDDILKAIRENPVVILEGGTGCGKTTQVPQYILDEALSKHEKCKIVCTQPRRIAAISIANRVCKERKCSLKDVVGYQIGLHNESEEKTPLVYCTTGVLLQKIIYKQSLEQYTHIILDEIHERQAEMDFLLIVLRRLLITNSKHLKIILMSATMNSSEFSNYFKIHNKPAPILKTDNRRLYKVTEYYLDDLKPINRYNYKTNIKPSINKELYGIAQKLIRVIMNIEQEEARLNIQYVNHKAQQASILVFLPGIHEIDEMCKVLQNINLNENVWKLYPIRLHSLLSNEEQSKVFAPSPQGFLKIILSTNIAESSITVPDVKYVIDFCLTKVLITDSSTGFRSLQLHWASRSNCRQRSGRAGRVMNGRVYRLVCRCFYEKVMQEYETPEILRCPLEILILQAKLLNMARPSDILALALSPPNLSDIHNAILRLKEFGALHTTLNGVHSIEDGDITYIGRIIVALPLDPPLSRLIILGYIFSVLEETLIIAAGLSVRAVFQYPLENPQKNAIGCMQKLLYADGSGSDLFAILKAYRLWENMRNHEVRDEDSEILWANRYFIDLKSLKEMQLLIKKIENILLQFNIKKMSNYQQYVHWLDREKTVILKIAIAGAFYPNYFTCSNVFQKDRERYIYNTIYDNDPFNTVYFKNFNQSYIGELYSHNIKQLFSAMHIPPKDITIQFPPGSEKVFIKFKPKQDDNDNKYHLILKLPGRVNPDIYKAVRMRLSGVPTHIHVMEPHAAQRYVEDRICNTKAYGKCQSIKTSETRVSDSALPSLFEKYLKGHVTYIESCDKFYFLPLREKDSLHKIEEAMNSSPILKVNNFSHAKCIAEGMIVAALHSTKYHRAKIIKVGTRKGNKLHFQVRFIDSGFEDSVDFDDLRQYPEELAYLMDLPPRVIECRLASLQPSTIQSTNAKWSQESKEILLNYVSAKTIDIEIFSLVHCVANVIVHMEDGTLNKLLVTNFLARETDESYLSKLDHDYRSRKQCLFTGVLDQEQINENNHYIASMLPSVDNEIESPPKYMCRKVLSLHGPYSPLETSVSSYLRVGSLKTVYIERESVNAVLLDSDPQDVHNRLIVASSINENTGDIIFMRGTTLMPNTRGIAALITMLFCPTLQVKRDKNHTKYIAILAGLGYDKQTKKPFFGEHDICLKLDVELDYEDFRMANQLRYLMNNMLEMASNEDKIANITEIQIGECRAKIKQCLIKYLSKNRKYIESHDDILMQWEIEDPKEVYKSIDILGKRAIFSMLSILRIQNEENSRLQALRLHCANLHQLKKMDNIKSMKCQLCNDDIGDILQLRIHLLSQKHRELQEQMGFDAAMAMVPE